MRSLTKKSRSLDRNRDAGGNNPALRQYTRIEGDLHMQQKLERNHSMTFRVTEKERDLICQKMKQANIKSLRAYLLKVAVDGRIIHVELDSVKEMNRLLSNATNNINQIAKRVNETGNVYLPDLDDIKARQDEMWEQQKEILKRLNKVLDVAK
jgi:hypothetical protein